MAGLVQACPGHPHLFAVAVSRYGCFPRTFEEGSPRPQSELRFIRRSAEFLDREEVSHLKDQLRGVYVLYKKTPSEHGRDKFDVRYVGMSAGKRGMVGRLRGHKRSKRRGNEWTHFSVFEVWNNVTDQEIAELEGLARHIFRKDPTAKRTLSIQRGFKKLHQVRNDKIGNWNKVSA